MKEPRTNYRLETFDEQEQARSRSLCEQCWLGPILLVFWALVIGAVFYGCSAKGAECKLEWLPAAPADQVTEWRVFRGIEPLATVSQPAATLDLPVDSKSTLSVFAVNVLGVSPAATITVLAAIPQDSADLRTWNSHRPFFYEDGAKHFFRFHIPAKAITTP